MASLAQLKWGRDGEERLADSALRDSWHVT